MYTPKRIKALPSRVDREGILPSTSDSVMPAIANVSPFVIGTTTDSSVELNA